MGLFMIMLFWIHNGAHRAHKKTSTLWATLIAFPLNVKLLFFGQVLTPSPVCTHKNKDFLRASG